MQHRATVSFWKDYDALDAKTRSRADKAFALLKHNPRHPSLQFKKLSDDLWSARISLDYRALALASEVGYDWIWIGKHSDYEKQVG